jgi:hypothetical protein
MTSNHVIETRPGEWLMAYNPVGRVCHFTRTVSEAKRVCMEWEPSANWAREALRAVRNVYNRQEARIING